MSERIYAFDWSKTAIGPVEGWSPALRMMVRFLLANRFPLLLWWGPDYVSIYNGSLRDLGAATIETRARRQKKPAASLPTLLPSMTARFRSRLFI